MEGLFPDFQSHWISTSAGRIFTVVGGSGPPVVLVHGFPQTHAMWHRIASTLAKSHTVVCPDLRGYGWSSVPASSDGVATYSKRTMATDIVAVMQALGHVRFAFVGHDRGARVGYRLALDQPGRIERLAMLDILPTYQVWEEMKDNPAVAPHWRFLSRPAPEPEREIGRNPLAYYEKLLVEWAGEKGLKAFDWKALKSYHDSWNEPTRIHASCEDYRAGATVDLEADNVDLAAERRIECETLLLWGNYLSNGAMASLRGPLHVWKSGFAPKITGRRLDCGHFLAEEDPHGTLAALLPFLSR